MMRNPLTLYHLPYCPYCLKVRRAAERLGVELELLDVSADPEARAELVEARGRGTVPVLVIPDGSGGTRLLPESDDIVAYLEALAADRAA